MQARIAAQSILAGRRRQKIFSSRGRNMFSTARNWLRKKNLAVSLEEWMVNSR